MKLEEIRISNIMSFKSYPSIQDAPSITFGEKVNVIIGENGAEKTTVLEVINFLFKRLLFKRYSIDWSLLNNKDAALSAEQLKDVLKSPEDLRTKQFRLLPNWNSEDAQQTVFLKIRLDDIDRKNIHYLLSIWSKLEGLALQYSRQKFTPQADTYDVYETEVSFNKNNNEISLKGRDAGSQPSGHSPLWYLEGYHLFNELIYLHNTFRPSDTLDFLSPPISIIGGYRNYNVFKPDISISDPSKNQLQSINLEESKKSLNENETAQPSIFKIVQLNAADEHKKLVLGKYTLSEAEEEANKSKLMNLINKKLSLIDLKAKIICSNADTWQYKFEFRNLKTGKELGNISSLSSGQKAIMHLIFESFGRGELKGGLIIIDEPEIHLHHQFQNEYLRIIETIAESQSCQFILVTHSDSFVNSKTIGYIKRLALSGDRSSEVFGSKLKSPDQLLVKILDNTKSTRAFFGNKVVLVEGESDRYLYSEILNVMHPEKLQDVTILDIEGKGSAENWGNFFKSFGLKIFIISDLDAIFKHGYQLTSSPYRIVTKHNPKDSNSKTMKQFMTDFPDQKEVIERLRSSGIFILSKGVLEDYYDPQVQGKKLPLAIEFCQKSLVKFLKNNRNQKSMELRDIFESIAEG